MLICLGFFLIITYRCHAICSSIISLSDFDTSASLAGRYLDELLLFHRHSWCSIQCGIHFFDLTATPQSDLVIMETSPT